MKKLLLAVLILTFFGCNSGNKENEIAKDKASQLTAAAEQSKEKISELPLGFQFGMNQTEIDEKLLALVEDNKLVVKGQYYCYHFPTTNGDTIESDIRLGIYNDELYSLQLSISSYGINNDTLIQSITNTINNSIDSLYKRASYYEKIESEYGDVAFTFSYWTKGNQVIFLRNNGSIDLFYKNAPVEKIVRDININEAIEEARSRTDDEKVDIKNSSWDGSVSQVKKYLKQNLTDPGSYESIEWSEVAKTESGYMVRHKYRAKNSFGGYVVQNQVFYINSSGTVTSVKDYE